MASPTLAAFTVALLLSFFSSASLTASPIISEFLAENQEFSTDEHGDSSDWIEVFNTSDQPVEMAGHSLTDDSSNPGKWIFPDIILPPQGFLLVFASGKDRAAPGLPLHTNFSLDGTGEYLALYAPEGTTPLSSFEPEFPNQFKNIAYGISESDSTDVGYLMIPTPSDPNGSVFLGYVADTQFSIDRGFYNEPVSLEITTATEGAAIRYTIDDSEPSASQGILYTGPIPIESTTIVRAMAVKDRYGSSNVDTQTYVFVSDVKEQASMDDRVTTAPEYVDEIEQGLGSTLPALSIVVDQNDFFGPEGIYRQFELSGRGAEVPISLEYFSPTDEADTFNIKAGIRIHGGNARSHPKKPFRLYFREEYSGGSGELEHALYEGSKVKTFEQLVLRGGGHDSWSLADRFGSSDFDIPPHASYMRDQFLRKTENDMGLLSPLGKYVHVYINGTYWGVYDLHERPNATYFSDHLGGAKDDWDVVHHPEFGDETYSVVSGNADAWEFLQSVAGGQVADAVGFERMQGLVDLDTYIDSMIVRMWSGDFDWCGPIFRTFERADGQTGAQNVTVFGNKNWYAGRQTRNANDRFHFFSWDAEMSMGLHLLFNIFGNTTQRLLDFDLSFVSDPGSPVAPYDALIAYPPFKRAFADRINKHLFNGGALTPEKTQPRLQAMMDQLQSAIIAESARWGNTSSNGRLFTRNDDWLGEAEWLRDTFLVERGDEMLVGFRVRDIFPKTTSPALNQLGGVVNEGQEIRLTTTELSSEIYFTTDGTDPAELPDADLLEVLVPNAPCVWIVPNLSNGALTGRFVWTALVGYPSPNFWWDGRVGLGFETGDKNFKGLFNTDVNAVMTAAQGSGLYCRVPFSIPSRDALDNMEALILRLRYDDGFVAYINSVRVASSNAPASVNGRSSALTARSDEEAVIEEAFDVTDAIGNVLQVGRNMLAIHGLNSLDDASDFLLAPRMELRRQVPAGKPSPTAIKANGSVMLLESGVVKARVLDEIGRWSALTEAFFQVEPALEPGNLALSEIHYRPSAPRTDAELAVADGRNDFEFLEIRNQRDVPLELNGATFTQGIQFTFLPTQLAPGERVVIVRNEAAFLARYGSETGIRIVGAFERDSKLSDMGETLTLISREGVELLSFRYNDKTPWPESADGEGGSLVYQPTSKEDDPSDPAHWSASLDPDGYPGHGGFTNYADWQAYYFPENQTAPLANDVDADPDGDDLPNLLEYAFGSHPRRPTERANFMNFATRETDGQREQVFQFLRRPNMEDISYALELSDDLVTWDLTDLTEDDLAIKKNINNRDQVTVTLSPAELPSGYGRLRATLLE
ncbi:MAG: hypothetical protein ACI8T1_003500 [Verrucomicrobiales bacterium]|jgi:hypothetical protein